VWLTPHLRDPQPEGERELRQVKMSYSTYKHYCFTYNYVLWSVCLMGVIFNS